MISWIPLKKNDTVRLHDSDSSDSDTGGYLNDTNDDLNETDSDL